MINWNRGWKLFLRSASSGSSQIEPKTIELKRLQTQIRRLWKFRLPTTELQMFSTRKKLRVFFSKCPTSSKNEIFPFAHASLQLPRENNILPFCCPKILAPSAVNCVQRVNQKSNFKFSNQQFWGRNRTCKLTCFREKVDYGKWVHFPIYGAFYE